MVTTKSETVRLLVKVHLPTTRDTYNLPSWGFEMRGNGSYFVLPSLVPTYRTLHVGSPIYPEIYPEQDPSPNRFGMHARFGTSSASHTIDSGLWHGLLHHLCFESLGFKKRMAFTENIPCLHLLAYLNEIIVKADVLLIKFSGFVMISTSYRTSASSPVHLYRYND